MSDIPETVRAALDSLRGLGGDDLVRQMVAVFVEYSDGRLAVLQGAADAGDFTEVASAAHTLKGSSRQLGLVDMADACLALEQAAKRGDAEATRTLAPSVRASFDEASVWLKSATA